MSDDGASSPLAPSLALEGLVSFTEPSSPAHAGAPVSFADRYERLELLGAGGMGEVWLCRDRVVGRDVAMKVIHSPMARSPRRWRFVREARVQGQLEHPSIVPVYDLGVDPDGLPYFTMRHVRGRSLAEVLRALGEGDPETRRRFGRRRLLSIFERVCFSLEYIHRRGVLHRDVKPSNLMLGELGEVYVLDWGLVKLLGDEGGHATIIDASNASHTGEGTVLGTPGYMSPEQLRGEIDELGPWSDVYSLGAILFEILAGSRFHSSSLRGTKLLQARLLSTLRMDGARPSERAPEREVPADLDALCYAATRLAPRARVPSAAAVGLAVQSFLDG